MSLSGDTKVFVGGLLPYTTDQSLVAYFGQFGEIVEAKIVMDRHTGRSKNYGFVQFRDPLAAQAAVANPYPYIDGKQCNCNLASLNAKPDRRASTGDAARRPPKRTQPFDSAFGPDSKRMKLDDSGSTTAAPPPSYLQILQESGENITLESATQKLEELASNPPDALKYFLEVGELFKSSGDYDTKLKDLIAKAREYRLNQARADGLITDDVQRESTASDASNVSNAGNEQP